MPHTESRKRTNLDLILDHVRYAQHEVTLDLRDLTMEQVQRVIDIATVRGLHAASDGKFALIRDLRCPHDRVGTTDNPQEYECMSCSARIPRRI